VTEVFFGVVREQTSTTRDGMASLPCSTETADVENGSQTNDTIGCTHMIAHLKAPCHLCPASGISHISSNNCQFVFGPPSANDNWYLANINEANVPSVSVLQCK